MKVALLGATGTIGSAVLAQALAEGHDVRVLVRAPDPSIVPAVTVMVGDARDPEAVTRVVTGVDAVIAAVGPRANRPDAVELLGSVARNVVGAMGASGVSRLVFVAGAGISLPGERRTLTQKVASAVVRRFARLVVEAKERESEIYFASGLRWTAVRPTRVRAGAATGRERLTYDRPAGFRVTSGDLAVVILRVLADPDSVGKAPFVSSG